MMMIWRSVLLALRQIRRNGLRAALTTLGVMIGVAAVIAMVALGRGATASVTGQLSSLGQNLLFVAPGSPGGGGPGSRSVAALFTERDVDAIRREVPGLAAVAPMTQTVKTALRGNTNMSATIVGSSDGFFVARQWPVASGREFTEGELKSGANVAVIGATVRDELFGLEEPIGGEVRVGKVSLQVIGVLEAKGQSTFGQDQDNLIVMPFLTFARRISGSRDVPSIMLSAEPGVSTTVVQQDVERLMAQRRRISPGEEPDFTARDLKEMARMVSSITGVLTSLLAAIAAISLLVGGIGIMNIMLVAVTERTREIGLRLSIGARARDVLLQFLVEAVVLSTLGGVVGIGIGLGGAFATATALELPFIFSPDMLLLPFTVSVAIGAVFGFVPARKAAHLNPIDALRHE
jgi:putative ABC transport system permease protein